MGNIITSILGETVSNASFAYIDTVDGKLYKAVNSDISKQATCYIAIGGSSGDFAQAYLDGIVNSDLEGWVGSPIYLSDTPGIATTTAPASPQKLGSILPDSKISLSISQKTELTSYGSISPAASFFKI